VPNVPQGWNLVYRIEVTNPYQYPLTGIVVTDVIPGDTNYVPEATDPPTYPPVTGKGGDILTWVVGTISPGQTRVINLGLHVYLNHALGVFTNTVYARSDQTFFTEAHARVNVILVPTPTSTPTPSPAPETPTVTPTVVILSPSRSRAPQCLSHTGFNPFSPLCLSHPRKDDIIITSS